MYKSRFATTDIDDVFESILKLESLEECYRFFEDLCTINEIQDMAQRWKVARMLDQGVSYHVISEETKASTATISRVSKSLTYGADGYKLMFQKQKDTPGK